MRNGRLFRLHRKKSRSPADTPDRRVIISGQGAFSYTDAQSRGELSKAGFRVDDARVYIESQIRRNTYLFGELILTQRQTKDDAFHLGEFYLDLENLFGIRWPIALSTFAWVG
jgi:hypothetical protein